MSLILSGILSTLCVPCTVYFVMVYSGAPKQKAMMTAIVVYMVLFVVNAVLNVVGTTK